MNAVTYHSRVVKEDIPVLSSDIAVRIRSAIETKLMAEPMKYGQYLHGTLKGYRKLRIGDYRIIYRVASSDVLIIAIGHQSVS